ncbi:hypothetical protein sphantq_04802 (plasmid) [Sphingobium sp. AntQ-1]|nr:hypothetical protein sphantq_04802 [Sphingobium sp. AntQ-1]
MLPVLMDHGIEDQTGDQRLGFLIPMGIAALPRCIMDQGIGQRHRIFGQIEAGGVETVERIVAGRGLPGHFERVEAPDLAAHGARPGGDAGVLALGVDADHRAVEGQQIGDDGAHALAAAGWGHRQQMGRTAIAQQLARFGRATDEQIAAVGFQAAHIGPRSERGRAEQLMATIAPVELPDGHPEGDQCGPGDGAGDRDGQYFFEQPLGAKQDGETAADNQAATDTPFTPNQRPCHHSFSFSRLSRGAIKAWSRSRVRNIGSSRCRSGASWRPVGVSSSR